MAFRKNILHAKWNIKCCFSCSNFLSCYLLNSWTYKCTYKYVYKFSFNYWNPFILSSHITNCYQFLCCADLLSFIQFKCHTLQQLKAVDKFQFQNNLYISIYTSTWLISRLCCDNNDWGIIDFIYATWMQCWL